MDKKDNNKSLIVWTRFQPTSTDPLLYDLAVHHITMRSVFSSLVSIYSNGKIEPQIAKRWSVSGDKKQWTMTIDEKWTFKNDEIVTPEIVVKNFKRILLIKNNEKSKSGLLEFLVESEKLKNITDDIEGLKISGQDVIFTFSKAMPEFLEKVSFGLYSIAHPSDYSINGEWKNAKEANSSGAYQISEWTDNSFILSLRNNLFINRNKKKAIQKIIFSFSKNTEEILNSDIMIREKYNPIVQDEEWTYSSAMQDNNIVYVQVMKWEDQKSFLHDRQNRRKLRDIFYTSLEESGLRATTSFFPLSIHGVSQFPYRSDEKFNIEGKPFTAQPFFFNSSLNNKKDLGEIYKNGFDKFCARINAVPMHADYPEKIEDEKKVFDIQFLGTGILIDSPKDDIRFMFNSKQGINLPDETGEIKKIISNEDFDVQLVNELLWDQAIIWPIRHYSMGFWLKTDSKIDLSQLNVALHPIDFQFVQWN
jgi:hypothetical protein